MAGKRIVVPNYMPALDLNGNPVAGAKLYFYDNGTTVLATVYTSATLSTAHPNPVVANAAGVFPSIFADEDESFSVAITDANDNPISGLRNRDNIEPSLALLDGVDLTVSAAVESVLNEDTLLDFTGAIQFEQADDDATGRSVLDKLRETVSVKDFGAVGDGGIGSAGAITSGTTTLTDSSAAFTTADVGKTIIVYGAGAAGANLTTTIASRNSATSVELAAAASTTVSAARYVFYGTDDTQAVTSFVRASFGKRGRVTPGIYAIQSVDVECGGSTVSLEFDEGATFLVIGANGQGNGLRLKNALNPTLRGINIDADDRAIVGLSITNEGEDGLGVVTLDAPRIRNCFTPSNRTTNTAGVSVTGSYDLVRIDRPVITDIASEEVGAPVARGIICGTVTGSGWIGYVQRLEVLEPTIRRISPLYDADGIFHNSDETAEGTSTYILNGWFEDCLKRAIKTQTKKTVWLGGTVYRTEGASSDTTGHEISAQSGNLTAIGQSFFYEDGADAPQAPYGVGNFGNPQAGPSLIENGRIVSLNEAPIKAVIVATARQNDAGATSPCWVHRGITVRGVTVEGGNVINVLNAGIFGSAGSTDVQLRITLENITVPGFVPTTNPGDGSVWSASAAMVAAALDDDTGVRAGLAVEAREVRNLSATDAATFYTANTTSEMKMYWQGVRGCQGFSEFACANIELTDPSDRFSYYSRAHWSKLVAPTSTITATVVHEADAQFIVEAIQPRDNNADVAQLITSVRSGSSAVFTNDSADCETAASCGAWSVTFSSTTQTIISKTGGSDASPARATIAIRGAGKIGIKSVVVG